MTPYVGLAMGFMAGVLATIFVTFAMAHSARKKAFRVQVETMQARLASLMTENMQLKKQLHGKITPSFPMEGPKAG